MARIKKYSPNLSTNLTYYETFVVDTNPNSDYFKITELKDTFTGGKNGFLIEGSEHLMESTEIKIEIIDVNGNAIYYEPGNGVPEYYEGLSKIIAVYIYEDTPIGDAKITVLGELKTYKDGVNVKDIPDNWKGVYNVKWEKTFKVNRLLPNEDTVRFYKRPSVNITEITKPIFSTALATITQTGSLYGTAITPPNGQPLANYKLPTFYKLTIDDDTNWTGSIVGTVINVPTLGYSAQVDSVINNKELLVKTPYVSQYLGSAYGDIVQNFVSEGYTASFSYFEGIGLTASALTGSFAKINISDLTTFVGDCARVKIFRKSQSQVVDYQFIQEIALESNELLIDLESTSKNQEYYGIFTQPIIENYWVTSSNAITATFNQDYLYDSVKLSSATSKYFYTSKSISLKEGSEYSLDFNIRLQDTISAKNYIRAFLSGSRVSTNGTIQIEQDITTIVSNNGLIQKSNSLNNIKAEQIDNAKLYFEVVGNNWYISNVSFKASKETAFSPDDITFIQSVPRELPVETFDYRFEFYGSNGKLIPVLVEKQKTFNGGNLQSLKKELKLIPSSLYFQFDSGSNPVPPTVINIHVQKTLLTGSVNYTSQSIDFYGDILKYDDYTASFTGQQYPGLLGDINSDNPFLTVQNFTGSRTDKLVQYLEITGETEGYTDTVVISRVLDGFGGVNHIIRPFRGLEIRNSSTQSLEIQAVRIDGVNDISLSSTTQPGKGWNRIQLHVISSSLEGVQKFVNLEYASSSGFIKGLGTGSLGTGEINYNATFNRDSIDKRLTVYLMPSSSNPISSSVLASTILSDFQDGLDSGFVSYTADTFTINPRLQTTFTPPSASATASFFIRGTNENPVSGSLTVFPSMSINVDYVPEYWMYYVTHSFDPHVSVIAIDDNKNIVPSRTSNEFVGLPLSQSKTLTVTWTYVEDYTSASVSVDKTFSIIPEGKPGDESIVFETNPLNVALKADAKGIVNSYDSSITEIKVKQGSKYLIFSSSAYSDPFSSHGQFYIASESIVSNNIIPGNLAFFTNQIQIGQSILGGKVGYILQPTDNGYDSNNIQGLIVSNTRFNNVACGASCDGVYITTPEGYYSLEKLQLGIGAVNTSNIITACPTAGTAAELCYNLTDGGYSDWYLPSVLELLKVMQNADTIGGFDLTQASPLWWSSTPALSPAAPGQNYLIHGPNAVAFKNITAVNVATRSGNAWDAIAVRTFSIPNNNSSSLFIGPASNFTQLSGSVEYPLVIHPYYTSSIYTASIVQNYTKILDGAPSLDVTIEPTVVSLNSDEVGAIYDYSRTSTTIRIKEGSDYLVYSDVSTAPGTFRVDGINSTHITNLAISGSSTTTASLKFNGFHYPYVSASAVYSIVAYPYSLGPGHIYSSSAFQRTQLFTKNVAPAKARTVNVSALSQTITYDRDTNDYNPQGDNTLTATAFNTTGSVYYYWFDNDGNEIGTDPTHLDNTHNPGDSTGNPGPGEVYTYIVKITDGNPYTSPTINPYRAEASVSVSGVKQGADAYKLVATNENTSITADLWTTQFTGSGIRISGFKGTDELIHTSSYSNATKVYDYLGTFIGNVGYYSASIYSKSNYITPASTKFPPSRPASIGDITAWTNPGTNKSGDVIYKVDFENGRQIQYVTQSIAVQFTPPAPYDAKLTNENASIVYRVSGEVEFLGTGTLIRAYRGDTILTNKPSGFTSPQTDAYGNTGYKEQCRITIFDKSGHITLTGNLAPGDPVPGISTSASLGTNPDWIGVTAWTSPETNPTGVIIYEIDCEGRQKLYKTQSLSVQFEGNTGPGVVMRGEWSAGTDYIGSVETTNYRRDAVIYNPIPGTTTYYAAVSGSGPGTAVGAQTPSGTTSDTPYWQYLGTQDFFVSAKIAIFEESYVKNTINVGTKNGTGAFANIVISGGRPDPYIAIGQNATVGTAGTSGTSTSPTGVIGYDRPGIFLGIYESSTSGGGAGTTGRFSISNADGTKALKWDGSTLTIVGALRQVTPGVSEGSLRGTWTTGFTYYANDIVSYAGQSWQCTSGASHVATNDTNGTTGYPGSGPWIIAAAAGTSGTAGTGGSSGAAGPAGSPGAGVVYRGVWADGVTYYKTTERTDIVKGSDNQYYICKATYTPSGTSTRPVDGGSYTTYWQSFGATFSSVATDVLLAQDATITRGLVLGTEGSYAGFLRSANANTITTGTGFYLDVNGNFRFGQAVSPGNNYVYWNGSLLDISGKITATEGNIGGFVIANNVLAASGSLLQIDTQIPQISFFRKGDLTSAKVVLNPSQYLSNPAADPVYGDYGADWTGTTSVTATAGTTLGVDTYVITDGISVKGITTDYLGTTTSLAAGTIDVTVQIPQTALSITAGTISTTSAYPPDPPTYSYQTYSSRYAGARSSNAVWYIQLYDSAGTTLITEQQLPNASTYKSGGSSYTYYYAAGTDPYYYWNGPNTVSSTGYYQGDIAGGARTTTVSVPAAGTYKVALCLRVTTSAGQIYDSTTYTSTYYGNTGTASHSSSGALTSFSDIRFKTNVNKTEISGGGVQVVTNESSYVRMLRVDPGSYSYSSLLFQVNGGRADFTPGGATLLSTWTSDAIWVWGAQYNVGGLRIGGGGTSLVSSGAYEVLKVDGAYTGTIANQFYATFTANILPYADDTFDLGKASSGRWRDIFTNGAVTTTSDRTKKANITQSILGLDFINKLQPVSYTMITGSKIWEEIEPTITILEEPAIYDGEYIVKEAIYKEVPNPQVPEVIEIIPGKRTHYGLIAQDVKIVLDEMGLTTNDFAGYMAADPIEHTDLGLRYEEFLSPMIKAIQELSSKVDRLEAEISSSKI